MVTADMVSLWHGILSFDLRQSRACFQGLSHGNSFGGSLSPQQLQPEEFNCVFSVLGIASSGTEASLPGTIKGSR